MSKYYAYIRVSTDKQTLENQKHKILEFAFNKKIQIEDFIEVEVSSKKTQKERLIEDLFFKLKENDTLVVTELSRLGRNMLEILNLIEKFTFTTESNITLQNKYSDIKKLVDAYVMKLKEESKTKSYAVQAIELLDKTNIEKDNIDIKGYLNISDIKPLIDLS